MKKHDYLEQQLTEEIRRHRHDAKEWAALFRYFNREARKKFKKTVPTKADWDAAIRPVLVCQLRVGIASNACWEIRDLARNAEVSQKFMALAAKAVDETEDAWDEVDNGYYALEEWLTTRMEGE